MDGNDKELIHALALNSVTGVGSITYRKLVDGFGSAERVFKTGRSSLQQIPRIQKATVEAILSTDPVEKGKKEIGELKRRGFRALLYGREDYPSLLSEIPDPPPVLYMAGELDANDDLAVAMVGTRNSTEYGRRIASTLARDLSNAGVTVISGMARGIDSSAHRGVINAGGRTISVIGSGLDVIYPPENRGLFEEIVKCGAVLSSFPLGARPDKGNFPARNRIISGMSLGVIVIEAPSKSGALITARLAHEQGREVFAVPGEAGSKINQGTNGLIKKGQAKLVENFKDVLEEILPQFDTSKVQTGKVDRPEPKLEGDEKSVWEELGEKAVHIDILARKCNLPTHRVASALLQLELKGIIEQKPGKLFVRATY